MISIAILTNDMNINGINTVLVNYCCYFDMAKFSITIFAGVPVSNIFKNKCDELGVKIVTLPARRSYPFNYYFALSKALSIQKFDIVHVHGNSATITPELLIAKIQNVKVRIAHSHNSTCSHILFHRLLKPLFNRLYTHGFACSQLAGRWLFGDKKFYVIPNGFKTERFKFNMEIRKLVRKELGIEEKFVIGHIGRFNKQKNHRFLLEIFEQAAAKNPNAWLLLVGSGPDFDLISNLIRKHPNNDRIIVYGETQNTENLYNTMDVFVFPSKFEGLGNVLLEAQVNGLPCISSNVVPEEVAITKNLKLFSLEETPLAWANLVLNSKVDDRELFFQKNCEQFAKYNIEKNAIEVSNLYSKFYDLAG